MSNVLDRIMAFINKRLAIFVLRCGFVLFLALDEMIVNGSKAPANMFTTKPKNKEIFVGDSVMFDWDYRKEELVKYISFGIVSNGSEGPQEVTLLRKQVDGLLYTNNKPVFKELILRIKAVEKSRASFNISNVRMNDTGKYFCTMEKKDDIRTYTEYVNLKVVDLQIDEKDSPSVVESWKNLKTSLVCVVRVVGDTPVTFTWLRQPNNLTLGRGKHIDTRRESFLTIITSSEPHFTTYTCVAKTKKTTMTHNVLVRQLYGPGPPVNLQQEFIFDKTTAESYHKVYWKKPKIDGGARITDYIVEYKPRGIDWGKATRVLTKDTKYHKFNLKEGKLYDVRVLARNKVDEGSYSNEVEIKLNTFPSTGARSNASNRCLSCLVSLLLLFMSLKCL